MTDLSPLQRLDDAVHAFNRATAKLDGEEPGTTGAWVLAYETSIVDADAAERGMVPLVYSTGYSTSAIGSISTHLGLLRTATLQIEDAFLGAGGGD